MDFCGCVGSLCIVVILWLLDSPGLDSKSLFPPVYSSRNIQPHPTTTLDISIVKDVL
jgi:hypothetical protein